MNEAILVRHAESEANALGIVNGDPSIPYALDAAGREQAAAPGPGHRGRVRSTAAW